MGITSVQELFEAQVDRAPGAIALAAGKAQLSYQALETQSNRLAHQLRARGVRANSIVAVDTGRTMEFVVAMLGVLKAGGAYLPLDDEYPPDRLALMIQDSDPSVIIRQAGAAPCSRYDGRHVITLTAQSEAGEGATLGRLPAGTTPEDLAYIIYTSGSTGRPKGVCMPHRPLVNLIQWQNSQSGPGHRTLQFAPLGFDVCFQEVLATVASGGTLVLPSNAQRRDFVALARLLVDASITRLFLPYVALECLADAVENIQPIPAQLQEVIVAGEQLRITPAIRGLFKRLPGARLINQYGPAETHVVTSFTLTGDSASWPYWPPIGQPIPNTAIHILDAERQSAPPGVAGELFIGGAAVAQGYLRAPELTAEKFIPDPLDSTGHGHFYRTGDLARLLPDGQIEFLGRSDDQVKIRGYRVELGEVEAVLAEHPAVRECVLTVRETASQAKYLAAYIVPRQRHLTSQELRNYIRQRLPDHMVPGAFVLLETFPLSPHGKVDKKALPDPQAAANRCEQDVLPATAAERRLSLIWQEVLERPNVSVREDFFESGGHSILAARLISKVNREFHTDLTVAQLFEHPTIETFARALDSESPPAKNGLLIPLQPGAGDPPLFFVWHNAPWERLRFKDPSQQHPSLYITEEPYAPALLHASARRDWKRMPTVEELAAPHAALIRNSGAGRCVVAGFSYGVVLAFEVAHQLRQSGVEVEAVFLGDGEIRPVGWERFRQWLHQQQTDLSQKGLLCLWQKFYRRVRGLPPETPGDVITQVPSESFFAEATFEQRWPFIDRIWVHALRQYRPKPLPARGVLFRCRGNPTYYSAEQDFDGCLGWKRWFTGGVQIVDLPGDHFTMWNEPHVVDSRRAFQACLQSLRSRSAISNQTLPAPAAGPRPSGGKKRRLTATTLSAAIQWWVEMEG
ncbi:MAG: amino acid adenylation domain-containing protein [Verrucomicrobiota bacterium]